MKVIKKINNNVALALNSKNEEVFIVGKGIGFQKTPYDIVDENIIEKIYIDSKNNIKIFDILSDIPADDICLAEKIIVKGKEILNTELNATLLITLSDHISFALKREREKIKIQSELEWEMKHLYPMEYEVGKKAIEMIEEATGISLPKSEATFIALHFVNAQTINADMHETTKTTIASGEILSIVLTNFNIDYHENSPDFSRLLTHVRYYIQRQLSNTALQNENEEIFQMAKINMWLNLNV